VENTNEIGPDGSLTPSANAHEWVPPPAPVDPPPAAAAPPPNFFRWEDPNWGILMAVLVWVASVVLLIVSSLVFAIPYYAPLLSQKKSAQDVNALLLANPKFLIWQVVSALPAHLLTLVVIWAVVTRLGKQPFWRSVRWGWGDIRNLMAVGGGFVGAMVLLYLSVKLKDKIGGGETMIDKLVESSRAARYLLAFLAAVSAPLVEELIYRGVLYPAAQSSLARLGRSLLPGAHHQDSIQIGGAILAVLLVSALFAGVHVAQYSNSLGVIAAISLLSLFLTGSRAVTGRVLPGFMIHLVFNGIQAVALIFGTAPDKQVVPPAPSTAALVSILHHLPFLS
jgi:membrane protease YdiL (CAAX protease family)